MSGQAGEINGWVCNGLGNHEGQYPCEGITYAIHVDEGVTPMFLACRAEGKEPEDAQCTGTAVSIMYPPPPVPESVIEAVAWEWYMPDAEEKATLGEAMLDHVEKGGLMLRKLTDAGREALKSVRRDGPPGERTSVTHSAPTDEMGS